MILGNELWSAALMGIVEGLTEFLPVSSTGHLILVQNVIEFSADKSNFFDVFIQLGAILAVLVLYFKRFIGLLNFKTKIDDFYGLHGIIKIFLACLPAFVGGALFHSSIKESLFFPSPVALALVVGALFMIWIEKRQTQQSVFKLEDISYKQALIIGLCQCASLWPGVSRSGSTIVGGMFVGLNRLVAAEFSFLIAVPVMSAATLYDFIKSLDGLNSSLLPVFAVGFIVSFVTAIFAIKFMIAILQRFSLIPFAVYRICLGIAVIVLHGI